MILAVALLFVMTNIDMRGAELTLKGSVPAIASCELESPSPSGSALGSTPCAPYNDSHTGLSVLPLNAAGVWACAKRVTLSMKTSHANLDQRIELPNRNLDIQQEILLHRPRNAPICAANNTKRFPSPAADP